MSKSQTDLGEFPGFRPAALQFFRDLAATPTRDWFQAHKDAFECEVKGPMGALIADLAAALRAQGVPLTGDPKLSQFRLNRDVRFSKDKTPYKTHCGATMTRDGSKMSQGLLYLHVDPKGSFLAAGFYQPEPPALQKLRAAIADAPEEFAATRARLARHKLVLAAEDALKRLPRGFEDMAGSAVADALRLRSLVVSRPIAEASLGDPKLVGEVAKFAKAAMPLLNFGWRAIDAVHDSPSAVAS